MTYADEGLVRTIKVAEDAIGVFILSTDKVMQSHEIDVVSETKTVIEAFYTDGSKLQITVEAINP